MENLVPLGQFSWGRRKIAAPVDGCLGMLNGKFGTICIILKGREKNCNFIFNAALRTSFDSLTIASDWELFILVTTNFARAAQLPYSCLRNYHFL